MHCGGPTSEAGGFVSMEDLTNFGTTGEMSEIGEMGDGTTPRGPVESESEPGASESPFGVFGDASVFGEGTTRGAEGDDRGYEGDHGPPGLVRSLMRSMGSVIWVLLFLAFTISRSCGN